MRLCFCCLDGAVYLRCYSLLMPDDNSLVTTHNASRLRGDLKVGSVPIYTTKTWDPLACGSQHSTFVLRGFVRPLDFLFPGYTHYILGFGHNSLETTIIGINNIAGGIGEVKSVCSYWLSMDVSPYCENSSNIQRVQRVKNVKLGMRCCSRIARRSSG